MSIVSPVWLVIMFGTIAVFWLLPVWLRHKFLIGVTGLFLLIADYRALILLLSFVFATQLFFHFRHRFSMLAALAFPTAALVFYKLQVNSDPFSTIQGVAIPLGLSYAVFRILHYIIERSRNNLPEHGFSDLIAYVFFLPTTLIGPIHRFPRFLSDRREGGWSAENISGGLERILIGYFKVAVIGNTLLSGNAEQWIANASKQSLALGYYLEAIVDSLNLYVQFSGYSDVAIGFAMMMGFRVMENFRFPFLQSNIADFWRCWHISLTSWSREYIFMSVLSITRKPYFAVLCSLLFIGLWHELSFRYISWGLYHGFGIVAYMQWKKIRMKIGIRPFKSAPLILLARIFSILLTANFFFLGFLLANQGNVAQGLSKMLTVLTLGAL